jgi:hypothetical protein
MKRTRKANKAGDELRPEYRFDYSKARPNRFAEALKGKVVAVVLEPDVARVFDSSESVNRFLRSVISAVPERNSRVPARKPRRRAS